jgi:hypothetical protein
MGESNGEGVGERERASSQDSSYPSSSSMTRFSFSLSALNSSTSSRTVCSNSAILASNSGRGMKPGGAETASVMISIGAGTYLIGLRGEISGGGVNWGEYTDGEYRGTPGEYIGGSGA